MQRNLGKELRPSVELFFMTIMFLLFCIILLSIYFSKIGTANLFSLGGFSFGLTIPFFYYISLALSIISGAISIVLVTLMFFPEKAGQISTLIPQIRLSRFAFGFYLAIILVALTIIATEVMASTSNILSDEGWRSAAFLIGILIYFTGVGRITYTVCGKFWKGNPQTQAVGGLKFGATIGDASLNIKQGTPTILGAYIGRIKSGSIAERMGLAPSDIVIQMNMEQISSTTEFEAAFSRLKENSLISLVFIRNRDVLTANATL